jgi:hypothetical protein
MLLVVKSWGLWGYPLGAFLRSNGIHSLELKEWRNQMSDGLSANIMMNVNTKKSYQKRIAKLEKELKGALAVIELQKEVQNFMEGAEQSTNKTPAASSSKQSKTRKKLGPAKV